MKAGAGAFVGSTGLLVERRRPGARSCERRRVVQAVIESSARPISVSLVALGCPKNTVDAEVMLGDLESQGIVIEDDSADADVIIVNTCGFIEDSKRESIGAILEAASLKETTAKGVVVTGCLAQRYASELAAELPEVDAVVGFENYKLLADRVRKIARPGEEPMSRVEVGKATVPFRPEWGRRRLAPKHSAYIRVAEGCDHTCTFCAIPSFRGKFRSKPWDQVVDEAHRLAKQGVVELNLIAEDTNQYGSDFESDPRRLSDLLRELATIEGIQWIRLLYCYPSYFTDDLIDAIAEVDKVVKYIDIPLQHISDQVLRRMQRPSRKHTLALLNRLRERIPELQLRSTFITGFPGETNEDHEQLVNFVREFKFHRGGFFTYSEEDNTPAADLDEQIDEEVKVARRDELVSLQQDIQTEFAHQQIGRVINVLVDRVENGHAIGRAAFDAPEIDCVVHLLQDVPKGLLVRAKVIESDFLDLIADCNPRVVDEELAKSQY
eukprot:Plantae.Rhodophyta-Purpureofilum_apyrenoidigerum.ctg23225.p1 GENE.Plantae.Rhodophyta-Purpureofilum_apyrenoidigerum.ctg23225~~Plantae.Rhodophyta-Purpureofilum_apyrenoidigerum.ctg23225.p1  ORF type:complete len:506 (+),score=102.55 Plantae.Rhodophyta-Purpureofilum_apyrenoidigerum.ctg23225:35-1519(+)